MAISTDLVVDKPKSARKKSRTGCLTCKKRRVKCDEGRPKCSKCTEGGYICDGYAVVARRNNRARRRGPASPCQSSSFTILTGPSIASGIGNETEHRYFASFKEFLVPRITAGWQRHVWSSTVPQACHEVNFVRDAAVALSALSLASFRPSTVKAPRSWEDHHEYALRQYGRALRSMRSSLAAGKTSFRHILMASLLMYAFELLYGEPGTALFHASQGAGMVWAKAHLNWKEAGTSLPGLEHEDVLASLQLKCQMLSVTSSEPTSALESMTQAFQSDVEAIPRIISDTESAYKYLAITLSRSIYYVQLCLRLSRIQQSNCVPSQYEYHILPKIHSTSKVELLWSYNSSVHFDRLSSSTQSAYSAHLSFAQRFVASLNASCFFASTSSPEDLPDKRILMIYFLAILVQPFLIALKVRSEVELELLTRPYCSLLLRLAQYKLDLEREFQHEFHLEQQSRLRPKPNPNDLHNKPPTAYTQSSHFPDPISPQFTADNGIIFGMWVVGMISRDPDTRMTVLDMLKGERQEGVFGTAWIRPILRWLYDMEGTSTVKSSGPKNANIASKKPAPTATSRSQQPIPEEARLKLVSARVDHRARRVELEYSRGDDGYVNVYETLLAFDERDGSCGVYAR